MSGEGRGQAPLRSRVIDAATEHLCGHRGCDNEKHRQRALALVVDVLDAYLSEDASLLPGDSFRWSSSLPTTDAASRPSTTEPQP